MKALSQRGKDFSISEVPKEKNDGPIFPSRFKLVRLFQSAADKLGIPTTTRGRNPHYGHEINFQFGKRTALTLSVSWDISDHLAHTVADTPEIIDPDKVYDIGSTTTLVLFVLSRETNF